MLADLGVSVVLGADTTKGLVDRTGLQLVEAESPASIIDRGISVVVQAGALSALAVDAAITVDGTAFKVRGWQSMEDGELIRLQVKARGSMTVATDVAVVQAVALDVAVAP